MKKILLICAALFSLQAAHAQLSIGLRGGISTTDLDGKELLVRNGSDIDQLKLSVREAGYGVHFGLFTRLQIENVYIQPELLFNSNSVDFTVEELSDGFSTVKNERYQYLDIPILIGIKKGPFRLQGGPVAHIFIDSKSELFDINGYDQKFDESTWGYQLGVGLDIWKFLFDLKYEGSFNNAGDHISFFGQDYNLGDSPGRFVASIGLRF